MGFSVWIDDERLSGNILGQNTRGCRSVCRVCRLCNLDVQSHTLEKGTRRVPRCVADNGVLLGGGHSLCPALSRWIQLLISHPAVLQLLALVRKR